MYYKYQNTLKDMPLSHKNKTGFTKMKMYRDLFTIARNKTYSKSAMCIEAFHQNLPPGYRIYTPILSVSVENAPLCLRFPPDLNYKAAYFRRFFDV